jgi:hypothetical protein
VYKSFAAEFLHGLPDRHAGHTEMLDQLRLGRKSLPGGQSIGQNRIAQYVRDLPIRRTIVAAVDLAKLKHCQPSPTSLDD